MKVLLLAILLAAVGCATKPPPPRLVHMHRKEAKTGVGGLYDTGKVKRLHVSRHGVINLDLENGRSYEVMTFEGWEAVIYPGATVTIQQTPAGLEVSTPTMPPRVVSQHTPGYAEPTPGQIVVFDSAEARARHGKIVKTEYGWARSDALGRVYYVERYWYSDGRMVWLVEKVDSTWRVYDPVDPATAMMLQPKDPTR